MTERAGLDAEQRTLLAGICVLAGAVSMVPSSYNFVLGPMLDGLSGSESQESLLRQLPSICALLVIFLSGALGARIGERRLIFIGSIIFTAGCATVGLAPVLPVATAGLVLLSAATSAMAVVGLALLSSKVTDPKARATAFAAFALVAPAVYMVFPVAAGLVLDRWSWRVVAALWTIGGLILIWGVWKLFPKDGPPGPRSELVTPALAGLALAAIVQTISSLSVNGIDSTGTLVRAAVALVSSLALIVTYRRTAEPSLSLASLRRGGMFVLLVVVIVVPFVNLWFYMTIGYQYVYGMSATQTALLFVPAQLAGVGGALISRKLIQASGITFAGVLMLASLSATLLITLLIVADTPIWIVVLIMSLYAIASVGAGVPVTNSIMNTAPPGEEGGASAFRGAATHIGTAIGVVVMSTIVYAAVESSLTSSLNDEGLVSTQSAQIAESLRDGASPDSASSLYAVPIDQVDEINASQQQAMIDGLHAHGLSGTVFIGAAAGIFWLARRRQAR